MQANQRRRPCDDGWSRYGEEEGLYKEQTGVPWRGQNVPPEAHVKAAQAQTTLIVPRDAQGNPSDTGKIVLISLGMSNTTQEFSVFQKSADADPNKWPKVTIVDCAQGGMAAHQWAYPEVVVKQNRPSPWDVMDQRLKASGVTARRSGRLAQAGQVGPGELRAFRHRRIAANDCASILAQPSALFCESPASCPDLCGLRRDAA
jgi:hypothetical protein